MFLENEAVICIKSNPPSDNWDYFNEKTELIHLPKRTIILSYPPGILNSKFENFVEPTQRTIENNEDIVKYATHTNIISNFIKHTNKNWLFILEDNVCIGDLSRIIEMPGLTIFRKDASVYLMDRQTASIFLENVKIYYTQLQNVFQDLADLELIKLNSAYELNLIPVSFNRTIFPFLIICVLLIFFFHLVYF